MDLMEGQSASSAETSASPSQDIYTRQSFFEQYPNGDAMQLQADPRVRAQQRSMSGDFYADSRGMTQHKTVIRAEGMRPLDATLGESWVWSLTTGHAPAMHVDVHQDHSEL